MPLLILFLIILSIHIMCLDYRHLNPENKSIVFPYLRQIMYIWLCLMVSVTLFLAGRISSVSQAIYYLAVYLFILVAVPRVVYKVKCLFPNQ
jgi:hypothetical protein